MASFREVSKDQWVMHLGKESASEVTVEVNMSREIAEKIIAIETARLAKLNPGHSNVLPQTPAAAILTILSAVIARGRY